MQSISLSQLIQDMAKSLVYTGEFQHIQEIKRLAKDLGYNFCGYPENEVLTIWDELPSVLGDRGNGDAFLGMVKEAWIETWLKRTHEVFKDKDRVVLMPAWANLAANLKWVRRECLDDVIAGLQKDKVPYMTMKRSVYEALKEKYGVR